MGKSQRGGTRRSLVAKFEDIPVESIADWANWPYRIGCPVWGCRHWGSVVYPEGAAASDGLGWYSRMFPTVEGNSTFYSVPPVETFEKWAEQSANGFRFCFKFPQTISHEKELAGCELLLKEWLSRLDILAKRDRLGPTFLQLGPSFSFAQFPQLAYFLEQLPKEMPWAVELRHRDWFDEGDKESRLHDLLERLQIDRVLFDSRPLNSMAAGDATESASQVRKPKVPLRRTVTGKRPMVRLIGRNSIEEVLDYWEEWAEVIADWIVSGLEPWIFTHAPDDTYAPTLVYALHTRVQRLLEERGRAGGVASLPSLDSYLQAVAYNKQKGNEVRESGWVQRDLFGDE